MAQQEQPRSLIDKKIQRLEPLMREKVVDIRDIREMVTLRKTKRVIEVLGKRGIIANLVE